jgi:site-specific DNA recombinase
MIGGLAPFGYEHVRKTSTAPATLAIKEPQASIVRSMFEMYTNGVGMVAITRWLERNDIKTRLGKTLWNNVQVRSMLECRTYTGNRYYRTTNISDAVVPKHKRGPGGEQAELICVKVPAIVSQELFAAVQKKLLHGPRRYVQPATRHLLRSLIECGECGSGFHSYRRYTGKSLASGTRRIAHKAAYKCNWRVREKMHLLDRIERCHNPEVATHLLEGKVMEMIRDTLLVPDKLRACMEGADRSNSDRHEHLVRKLERFTDRIAAIEGRNNARLISMLRARSPRTVTPPKTSRSTESYSGCSGERLKSHGKCKPLRGMTWWSIAYGIIASGRRHASTDAARSI